MAIVVAHNAVSIVRQVSKSRVILNTGGIVPWSILQDDKPRRAHASIPCSCQCNVLYLCHIPFISAAVQFCTFAFGTSLNWSHQGCRPFAFHWIYTLLGNLRFIAFYLYWTIDAFNRFYIHTISSIISTKNLICRLFQLQWQLKQIPQWFEEKYTFYLLQRNYTYIIRKKLTLKSNHF